MRIVAVPKGSGVCTQAIGLCNRSFRKSIVGDRSYMVTPHIFYFMHLGKSRLAASILHRYNNRGLSCRASSSFAWLASTKIGVIHLNKSPKLVGCVPVGHGLAYLVSHGPNGLVGLNLEHPLERQHRYPALRPCHQEDHPKPSLQRCPSSVEDCPRGQRRLISTRLALVKATRPMNIVPLMTTSRALVTLWPAHLKQMLLTRLFRAKLILKFLQAQ